MEGVLKVGLLLDNCQTGLQETVSQDSIDKLRAMQASVVGTLWTGGTQHGREVYDRCEAVLDHPLYIVRVGGHRQTPDEWLAFFDAAIDALPDVVLGERRVVIAVANEPNLEGWHDDPVGYGQLFAAARRIVASPPLLFACPSLGVVGWERYLETALAQVPAKPANMIANLYDYTVEQAAMLRTLCGNIYIGEVNRLALPRVDWLRGAFDQLAQAGVVAATLFIAGGKSGGSWDDRYIISKDEAAGLAGWTPPPVEEGPTMPEFTLGFKDAHDANPILIGEAISDLMYDSNGTAVQYSENGRLEWCKQANKVQFYADALKKA